MPTTHKKRPEIEAGVKAALQTDGYLRADGNIDWTALAARVTDIVTAQPVLDKTERDKKAVTKGELVAQVLPSLAGSDDIGDAAQRALAEEIITTLTGRIWSLAKTSAEGAVQTAVAAKMGNGYILCRKKVGIERTDAVYVTDDMECIQLDFLDPDMLSLTARINLSTRNRDMLIKRQPHNAKSYAAGYKKALKLALTAAEDHVNLTAESHAKAPE